MKNQQKPKYLFYATLLDSFQYYLSSSDIYMKYWGNSENPSKTEEEFEKESFQDLIDSINRVPFESEAADRGTAFNEVIDCIIENRKSDKMVISRVTSLSTDIEPNSGEAFETTTGLKAVYNGRTFIFPIGLCMELANYYKGAVCQVFCEAPIETRFGTVLLYGYIDELLPTSVHDIKTTGNYKHGKFANNWQHIVYPYCLNESGNEVFDFEYNIVYFDKERFSTHTEHYNYVPERDKRKLINHLEEFIQFLETNRSLITDKKIFNYGTN